MDRFIKIGEVYGYKKDEEFNYFFPDPDKIRYRAVNVNHIRQITKNTYDYARIWFATYECMDTDQDLDSLVDKLNGRK